MMNTAKLEMHNESLNAPVQLHSNENSFKGYTLEELRARKVVNELKIDIVKNRIRRVVSPHESQKANTVKGYVKGFDFMMRYFNYAVLTFGISRRLLRLFRRFKK